MLGGEGGGEEEKRDTGARAAGRGPRERQPPPPPLPSHQRKEEERGPNMRELRAAGGGRPIPASRRSRVTPSLAESSTPTPPPHPSLNGRAVRANASWRVRGRFCGPASPPSPASSRRAAPVGPRPTIPHKATSFAHNRQHQHPPRRAHLGSLLELPLVHEDGPGDQLRGAKFHAAPLARRRTR